MNHKFSDYGDDRGSEGPVINQYKYVNVQYPNYQKLLVTLNSVGNLFP